MTRKRSPEPSKKPAVAITIGIACAIIAGALFLKTQNATREKQPNPVVKSPTFARDISPILFEHCAPCHRAGQSAPFELLTYSDAKKRAHDIAKVTAKRIMPPWLPRHGYGEFKNERRLTDEQIASIQNWVNQGAVEGNPADQPPLPKFSNGWQLGEPDLVVQPGPYTLPAEGKDVYYNFVLPIPSQTLRYVAGVELLPGSRSVHHCFIMVDETTASRRQAARLTPPGFPGMDVPESAAMPGGQLLAWQPGKIPSLDSHGLSWILRKNTDLVLQVHMNPSGKLETVQPKLGFYFTNTPPTQASYRLRLSSFNLDIPAGHSNYVTETSYVLPVDLRFVRVGGHAHYLCKEMQGFATLPNGEKKWLLRIDDWDFKWQGDYEYKEPVFIPQGSKITMRFAYDNTANNIRNPFNPPRRALWGLNTTDEMGELYFQTIPPDAAAYQKIAMDYAQYFAQVSMDFYRFRLRQNPEDAEMHQRLGRSLLSAGQLDEAVTHFNQALKLDPNDDKAYFDLGSAYLRQGRSEEAYIAFQNVVRINPDDSQAFGSLGIIAFKSGRSDEARRHLMNALRINPEDTLAAQYLQRLNSQAR